MCLECKDWLRKVCVPADDVKHHDEVVIFEVGHVGAQDVGLHLQLNVLGNTDTILILIRFYWIHLAEAFIQSQVQMREEDQGSYQIAVWMNHLALNKEMAHSKKN